MKWCNLVFALILAALLVSCGSGQSASTQGGGATETSNGLTARILLANGTPAAKVMVHLIPTASWLKAVYADSAIPETTITTNSQGQLHLDSLPTGSWNLQVVSGGQGLLKTQIQAGQNLGDLALGPLQILHLQVANTDQIRAAGTLFVADSLPTGSAWTLNVPAGNYLLVSHTNGAKGFSWNEAGHVSAQSQADTSNVALSPSDSVLLVDDFADNDTVSDLFPLLGCGSWFHNSSDNTLLHFAISNSILQMTFADTNVSRYVVTGISFYDHGYRDVDFSAVQEMCIQARGQGDLYLKMEQMISMTQEGLEVDEHWPLDSNWTTYCINPSTVDSVQWNSLKSHINTLTFALVDGSWLQLDNLVLHGVGLLHYSKN